jgi:hypothetical protein
LGIVIVGYHAAVPKPGGEDSTEERLAVTVLADTGMIPSKAELERIGDIIMEEVDKIVHALMMEKEDPKYSK